MVSYNVAGLFTNIPLQETIDIAVNIKISKPGLNTLFLFVTSETHILFSNRYYDQIEWLCDPH